MRIITDFFDYYDSARSDGNDDNLVFERFFSETVFKPSRVPIPWRELVEQETAALERFPLAGEDQVYKPFYACVGGRIYPGFQLAQTRRSVRGIDSIEYASFYDAKTTYDAIRSHPIESLRGGPTTLSSRRTLTQRLEQFFQTPLVPSVQAQLAADSTAIAVLLPTQFHKTRLLINPSLAHFRFFKVMDAWTTFNAIDEFLADPWSKIPRTV
jgi:hypothetical protein